MFVFISALSAGRHDAILCSLHWMSTSALKSNITQLCTFFSLLHFFFLFCKEEIRHVHKEASIDLMRETPKRKKPAWGV